jgi:hypothetical protein
MFPGKKIIGRVNESGTHHHETTSISSVLMAWGCDDALFCAFVILPLQAGHRPLHVIINITINS